MWILFLTIFILVGILSWERILPKRGLLETILIGSLWGLILSSALPFLLALVLPFKTAVVVATALAAIAIVCSSWLGRREWQTKLGELLAGPTRIIPTHILFLVFLAVVIPFLVLVSRTLFINQDGAYSTGFRSAYGDVPFHLTYITSFAWGENFPAENPDYAGTLADYPFLPYIPSASLVALGADLRTGFLAPGFLLVVLATALLVFVPWRISGNMWVAGLVPVIFLLSGGLGFWWFFEAHGLNILAIGQKLGSGILDEATNIPARHINLMNVMLSSLLPQRGVLFGLPIFLAMLVLWFQPTMRSIISSAVLMGSLPLLHPHTFITLGVVLPLFILSVIKQTSWRPWVLFLIIVFVMTFPVLVFFSPDVGSARLLAPERSDGGQGAGAFLRFINGWMRQGDNFFWYWVKNLGMFLPLLLLSFFLKPVPISLKTWYLPFVPIFFVANFIAFSPWEFDNHKLFNFWYLVSAFLVAYTIVTLFKQRFGLVKLLGAAVLILVVLSGAIEVTRLWASSKSGFALFNQQAQELGEFLRLSTPPGAVFLDSSSHLSPVVLSGRKRFMGYAGWLFAHGIDYRGRESHAAEIYRGGEESETLLKQYGITHVLIGREELQNFAVNVSFFEERFEKIYDKEGYQVFRIQFRN